METAGKIAALAAVAVVFCVILRENQKPLSVLLSIAASIGILLMGLRFAEPILETAKKIQSISGISNTLIKPLVKVVGISFASSMASTVCIDAGETALGKAAEVAGTILAVYASLPLVLAALELIEKLMGGM